MRDCLGRKEIGMCYELNCECPPNSMLEVLTPSVMVFGGGALGKQLVQMKSFGVIWTLHPY